MSQLVESQIIQEDLGLEDARIADAAELFSDIEAKEDGEIEVDVDVDEESETEAETKQEEVVKETPSAPEQSGMSNEELSRVVLELHNNNLALQKQIKELADLASKPKEATKGQAAELPDSLEDSIAVLAKRYKLPEEEVVAKLSRSMAMRDEPDNVALKDELLELRKEFREYKTSVEEASKRSIEEAAKQQHEARLEELGSLVSGMHADEKAAELYPHLSGLPPEDRKTRVLSAVRAGNQGDTLQAVFDRLESQAKAEWEYRQEWYSKRMAKKTVTSEEDAPVAKKTSKIPPMKQSLAVRNNQVGLTDLKDEEFSLETDDPYDRINSAASVLPL